MAHSGIYLIFSSDAGFIKVVDPVFDSIRASSRGQGPSEQFDYVEVLHTHLGLVMYWGRGAISTKLAASTPECIVVKARQGVSVCLLPDWQLQDSASNLRQQSRGNSFVDLAGLSQAAGHLLLQAYGPHASVAISSIPGDVASQDEVAALPAERIVGIDRDFRADLEALIATERGHLISYRGTTKEQLGGLWSLATRYTYQVPDRDPQIMESHRVFLGTKSIGVMLQRDQRSAANSGALLSAIRQSVSFTNGR